MHVCVYITSDFANQSNQIGDEEARGARLDGGGGGGGGGGGREDDDDKSPFPLFLVLFGSVSFLRGEMATVVAADAVCAAMNGAIRFDIGKVPRRSTYSTISAVRGRRCQVRLGFCARASHAIRSPRLICVCAKRRFHTDPRSI